MIDVDTGRAPVRPLPQLDDTNRDFWTGGSVGELRITRCADCGRWTHPPQPRCPFCRGTRVAPEPVSGRGTLYTYTVNHHQWYPTMPPPYVVGIVQLAEQDDLRLTAGVTGCAVDDVHIGLPLRVVFLRLEDVWLPYFEPDPEAGSP